MSNVIEPPLTSTHDAATHAAGHRHAASKVLANPPPRTHAVQFYDDDAFLLDAVSQYLAAGLRNGDRLLMIATKAHCEGVARRLEAAGGKHAAETGQLLFLDARETLSKFMIGDMPDADIFLDLISSTTAKLKGDELGGERIRAYGEMVDLLWRDGNSRAAIRLEELWDDAGKLHPFSLLCAYVMGNFYKESDQQKFFEVCRNHNHVFPTEGFPALDDASACLREISLLQQRARALESEIQHRKDLESALRDALRERSRAQEELRASLAREREARAQAEANDAFKEVFLGILGHDLRNPLNTVLTTARLMTMRRELPAESQRRLERIVSSGVRMQRMVDQLLDLTRARLADGIPVTGTRQDLVPLVSKIVDEIRVANPTHEIEFVGKGPCSACVDGDRFEQVVSNLLGNAVAHGDPAKPIRVVVAEVGNTASVRVHNYGTPIDPAFMATLFDPFKREKPHGRSDGLGLGLYISERIVSAHGGRIEVESSHATGTRFEVILPRS
jgi:signal transduction histidine kinase